MKKLIKIVAALGILLLLFCALVVFTFYRLAKAGDLRSFVISEMEKRTHLRVSVGATRFGIGTVLGISVGDLALVEPDSGRPVITAERAVIRVALLPLLARRVVFNEIRFYHPTLRIEQDEKGKIPLADLIFYLPMREEAGRPFTLDLRQIRVEKGEVIFADRGQDGGSAVRRLGEMDLDLRRVPAGQAPQPGTDAPLQIVAPGGGTLALDFRARAAIENEHDVGRTWIDSKGRIFLPAGGFDFRRMWLDADTKIDGLPAGLLREASGDFLPVRGLGGILSPHFRWQGSLSRQVSVRGRIDFKQLQVDAPDLFSNVVTPGDGRLDLDVEWTPQEVRFPRLELNSAEIHLSAQGSVRSREGEEPLVEVSLTTPFLPLHAVRGYLPFKLIASPWLESLVKGINQGEVKLTKAGVSGPLSGIRRLYQPGFEKLIWADAALKDVGGVVPGNRSLPLRAVSGRLVLEQGVLYYKNFKGMVGLSQLADVDGSQKGIFSGRRYLELRVKGQADLSQLREQLKLAFPQERENDASDVLEELNGKGRMDFLLRTDFAGTRLYDGQLSLDNARLRVGGITLTQVRGGLSFSPKEIRAQRISGLLGGYPLLIKISLGNYLTERSTFDLTVDSSGVRAGDAFHWLISRGSPQDPGMVRGSLHYYGSLSPAGERNLTGLLDLTGVQLPLQIFRQPLREVRGRVVFDSTGFELQGMKGQVAGHGIDFSGRWSYLEKPQLVFALGAAEMDISDLLPQEATTGNEWMDRLRAKGKIRLGRGRYEGFEFSDLQSDLVVEDKVWRLENFSAHSLGGMVQGSGTFEPAGDGLRFAVEPRVQGVPLQGFLKWFDMGAREITGKVYLSGRLESRGASAAERKRNLTGSFQLELKDGIARRLELLVRILNTMDLTRWFSFQLPDFKQQGIRFRSVTGDFKVEKGIYATDNLVVDSDDISITGTGRYDGSNDSIDAVLAFRPFPRVGSVVSYIPLIGPGIAGIKDTVLVSSFHVRGPVDHAAVTPAPLSTLSEFLLGALKIPQKILTIPGTGKK